MESLQTAVRRNLKGAQRIAILAIGSSLRGDDAAGLQVAEELRCIRTKTRAKSVRSALRTPRSALRFFIGETAPENLTGPITKFRPTHLVILDAADSQKRPGSISIIEHETLRGGSSISTHNLPVNVLIQYIQNVRAYDSSVISARTQHSVPCKVLILGIQPKSHEYGQPISTPVKKAVQRAASALAAALRA